METALAEKIVISLKKAGVNFITYVPELASAKFYLLSKRIVFLIWFQWPVRPRPSP